MLLPHMAQPLLEFQELRFAYDELKFDYGNASIAPGEIVVIVGPSGAGKSTLMRLLRGELDPGAGKVIIAGKEVETRKKRLVLDETKAGWVPQLDDLQSMLSLEDNIGHHILRMDPEDKEARVEELKAAMHLQAYSGQKVRTLSGGQRQRVSIAKAMAGSPPVLLMDESLAQLDLRTKSLILMDFKAMVKREGCAALLVLHDPADALFVADTLWVIRGGKLVQQGKPNEIIAEPIHHEIAGLFDYINVVPKEVELPGKWRDNGNQKWCYAHELPELDTEVIETIPLPKGEMRIYNYEGHRLISK